jgi:hypothetical protein
MMHSGGDFYRKENCMRIFRREWFAWVTALLFGREKENIWSNGRWSTRRGVITNEWHKIGTCQGCGFKRAVLTLCHVETTSEKNKVWRTFLPKWMCTKCSKANEIFGGELK